MKLFIPALGTVVKLSQPWTFILHHECRNLELFGLDYHLRRMEIVTIPAGAELKIERIFIRKGSSEYNSVTFFWQKQSIPAAKKGIRFWAKLDCVNKIEFEDSKKIA